MCKRFVIKLDEKTARIFLDDLTEYMNLPNSNYRNITKHVASGIESHINKHDMEVIVYESNN